MTIIRQYNDADFNAVLFAWENASELAHPFLTKNFQDQVRKDIPELYLPNADTWVVELDGLVCGFIALLGNEVGAIFLLPEHHGKGLGKLMMDKALELHGDLELEVFERNIVGRSFYKSYGFRLLTRKIHEETGEVLLRLRFDQADK